jgi:hypothetical protein
VKFWPAAAAAVAAGEVAVADEVVVGECAAAVAAAPFGVVEEGVPQWGAHLPCRGPPDRDPRWVGHPAAASPAVEGRVHVPAVAVARIMETCRLPAVGQDLVPVVPAAEIWRVAECDPVAHVRVAHDLVARVRVEYSQVAYVLAAATWRVAARALAPVLGPAVVHQQVI